ncbi:MAG: carboxypeptidase regulatory-like domain-containing protein [Acidobacteria bacterium]|nr:carboxypeptidase regulatory-like domain-containing protein [Acidobacteriota bacterium]
MTRAGRLKSLSVALLFLLAPLVWHAPVQAAAADSPRYLMGLQADDGLSASVFLHNRGSESASILLVAFDVDGARTGSVLRLALAAGEKRSISGRRFPSAAAVVKVLAPVAVRVALRYERREPPGKEDVLAQAEGATRLEFPRLLDGDFAAKSIVIVNLTESASVISVTALDDLGYVLGSRELGPLEPLGSLRFSASEISGDDPRAVHLRVEATGPVAGFQMVNRDDVDLVSLPGLARASGSWEATFTTLAGGDAIWSALSIYNQNDESVTCSLKTNSTSTAELEDLLDVSSRSLFTRASVESVDIHDFTEVSCTQVVHVFAVYGSKATGWMWADSGQPMDSMSGLEASGAGATPITYDASPDFTSAREEGGIPSALLMAPLPISQVPEATSGFTYPLPYTFSNNGGYSFLDSASYSGGPVKHPGEDWNVPGAPGGAGDGDLGLDVLAAAKGVVVYRSDATWGGVVIQHNYKGQTWYSQYGHVQKIVVNPNDPVERGQKIAEIGRIGVVGSTAHLHFEIRESDHPNPTYGDYWTYGTSGLNSVTNVENWYEAPNLFIPAHPSYSACIATVGAGRWKGEYFNVSKGFTGSPIMVRDDGVELDRNFGADSPSSTCGVRSDDFSVRWKKTETFAAGSHRFSVASDDGFRLYVDGTLKLDKWYDQPFPSIPFTVDVTLAAGSHTVKVEYYEKGGVAAARVAWAPTPGKVAGTLHAAWAGGPPLAGATVRCGGISGQTLADGSFLLKGVPSGSQTLSFSMSGHADFSTTVKVPVGSTYQAGDRWLVNKACIASVGSGSWKGEYFPNRDLTGATMIRNDGAGALSFDWGTGSPNWSTCGIPVDNFSVKWTRSIFFGAGNHRFTTTTDDGVKLYVNGTLVIDKWIYQAPNSYAATVNFTTAANRLVEMRYFEGGGGAVAKLAWADVSAGGVTGRLHVGSATGAVLSGATVTCGGKTITTDANGYYTLTGIGSGAQTLAFTKPGYDPFSRSVTITAGQTLNAGDNYLTATPTTGGVTGRLHVGSATGAALSGATVTCGGKTITTDANGYYTLTGIASGTKTLAFSKSGYVPFSKSVTITVGQNLNAGDNYLTKPTIAQTPSSGSTGTRFVQWGTGFSPGSTGTFHCRKPDGTEYTPWSQHMDADGHFEVSYTVDAGKPRGTYRWWIIDGPTGIKSNEVTYTVN